MNYIKGDRVEHKHAGPGVIVETNETMDTRDQIMYKPDYYESSGYAAGRMMVNTNNLSRLAIWGESEIEL